MTLPCPIHLLTDEACGIACYEARRAFERSSADLEQYWLTVYGRGPVQRMHQNEAHAGYLRTVAVGRVA